MHSHASASTVGEPGKWPGEYRFCPMCGTRLSTKEVGGKPRPVGLLAPNPLGLFDVLGNVEEGVLEPFRLHKVIRLHGQAGGFITKGGHYFTRREDLRSAYRREYPPFDHTSRAPVEVATIGLRLALGALAVTSREDLEEVKDEWARQPGVRR